jgi:glycosyltransferase involved in cell wall biosynthesis
MNRVDNLSSDKSLTQFRRLIVIQPALPAYRIDFFNRVKAALGNQFVVYYSLASMGSLTAERLPPPWAVSLGLMRRLVIGAEWQTGALSIPMKRGDIVIISGAPRALTNILLLLKARAVGARSIWWGHFWSSTSRQHRFLLRMLIMKLANAVLFYTDQEVLRYREKIGKDDRRPVAALNNGINTEPIELVRQQYDALHRQDAVLFIGRLVEKAALEVLMRAIADPRLAHVRLDVIGDGEAGGRLRIVAAELGITERVRWLGGTVREEEIGQVANVCKAFVYPGPVGLSLIHAMAYGLPALVHGDRWQNGPEIAAFSNGDTGLSFEQGNAADLAEKLSSMLAAPAELNRWSNESLRRVGQSYNTKVMTERLLSLVSELSVRDNKCRESAYEIK